jgi:hypothetical protein
MANSGVGRLSWQTLWFDLRGWPPRRWLTFVLASGLAALATGVPTGVVPSSLYHRMTPVTWWDYPIWAASALLVGLVAATYVRVGPRTPRADGAGKTVGGGVISAFAIGCPICNKLVVALVGVSGALNYWAPLQPFLGLASVGLLVTTLTLRLRGLAACRIV